MALEDDVIAWCRRIGYAPKDASLSRSNVAKMCKAPGARPFLEFFVKVGRLSKGTTLILMSMRAQNFHSASEVKAMRESSERRRAGESALASARLSQRLSSLEAAVPHVERQNALLRKTRDQLMVGRSGEIDIAPGVLAAGWRIAANCHTVRRSATRPSWRRRSRARPGRWGSGSVLRTWSCR